MGLGSGVRLSGAAPPLQQDPMQLVGVFRRLDPHQHGHRHAGVLVVQRRVGDTHDEDVVLAGPRARHVGGHQHIQEDVACGEKR